MRKPHEQFSYDKLDKNELENLYLIQKLSISNIAKLKGCSYGKIQFWFAKYNIKKRIGGSEKGRKFSEQHRKNMSISRSGKNNPNFGKKCPVHGKRIWYQCPDGNIVSMRSRWEVAYAEYLNENNIAWSYEPKTFNFSNGSAYTPDFYLINSNEYIEIKGWMTEAHKIKIDTFNNEYANLTLRVLQMKELLELNINLNKDYPNCDLPKFTCEQCKETLIKKHKTQMFCSINCRNKWVSNNKNKIKLEPELTSKRKYNRSQAGHNNNSSKLAEKDVFEIFELRKKNYSLAKIAELKNTSLTNVGNILNGRSWTHLHK